MPDISWVEKCNPGDAQENTPACAVFAMANWVECMTGKAISDDQAILTWHNDRMRRHGNVDGGMSIPESFFAAYSAGWFPRHTELRRVYDLSTLALAPIIATYSITKGWKNCAGRMIDETDDIIIGQHAVLLVDCHQIQNQHIIGIENSWSADWAENGFGYMTEEFHTRYCSSLWQIIVAGKPATIQEATAAQMRMLAAKIGNYVSALRANLVTLGYDLPCESAYVLADIVQRSTAGILTNDQERAKGNLADVWMILRAEGVTDQMIIGVWDVINRKIK